MVELIEKYIRYLRYEKNYSSHTEISYYTDLKQFAGYVAGKHPEVELKSVDKDIVRLWIASLMDAKFSARSVNRKLSTLKSFYRFLLKNKIVNIDPVRKIRGPKTSKPLPSFVNYADMEKVLDDENFDSTFASMRNKIMLELFYATGMRRAELIDLKDIDVDLSGRTVLVTGKRNKQRLIPISNSMKQLLANYQQIRKDEIGSTCGHFFVKEDGKQLYPMLVYRIVVANLKFIPTLAKASPHILRHSFATGMLNNGADINAVKELLGHASLAATEIYTHTSFEELKKIYNQAHPRA